MSSWLRCASDIHASRFILFSCPLNGAGSGIITLTDCSDPRLYPKILTYFTLNRHSAVGDTCQKQEAAWARCSGPCNCSAATDDWFFADFPRPAGHHSNSQRALRGSTTTPRDCGKVRRMYTWSLGIQLILNSSDSNILGVHFNIFFLSREYRHWLDL